MKPTLINNTLEPPERKGDDDQEHVLDWVRREFKPDEIFSEGALMEWAERFGYTLPDHVGLDKDLTQFKNDYLETEGSNPNITDEEIWYLFSNRNKDY